jgi:MFS family permease
MLPLGLLAKAPTSNMMWSSFFFSLANNGILFNVPLYLQAVRQTSPTVSGLYLTSPLVGVGASAIFSGYYITYTRRFTPMLYAGTICLLAGTVATTLLSPKQPLWTTILMIPWASIGQGLYFPTVTIATLAVNSLDDQAVVVTTLGLLRSLGSIMGVAVSSWIFQNSLSIYLEKEVRAPEGVKRRVIREVRRSVGAIKHLEPELKATVTRAYAESLRWTFAQGLVWAVVVGVLTLIVRLPKLQKQSEKDQDEDDGGEEGEDGERRRRGFRRSNSNRSRHSAAFDGTDEEALLREEEEEDAESEADTDDMESYDGDVERTRLERVRSHSEALQLGRRASHDTTL